MTKGNLSRKPWSGGELTSWEIHILCTVTQEDCSESFMSFPQLEDPGEDIQPVLVCFTFFFVVQFILALFVCCIDVVCRFYNVFSLAFKGDNETDTTTTCRAGYQDISP